VITGMLAATTIAIFIIPMLFVLVEKIAARLSRKLHPHDAALPSPSGADD
jgi:hypothetical protein